MPLNAVHCSRKIETLANLKATTRQGMETIKSLKQEIPESALGAMNKLEASLNCRGFSCIA